MTGVCGQERNKQVNKVRQTKCFGPWLTKVTQQIAVEQSTTMSMNFYLYNTVPSRQTWSSLSVLPRLAGLDLYWEHCIAGFRSLTPPSFIITNILDCWTKVALENWKTFYTNVKALLSPMLHNIVYQKAMKDLQHWIVSDCTFLLFFLAVSATYNTIFLFNNHLCLFRCWQVHTVKIILCICTSLELNRCLEDKMSSGTVGKSWWSWVVIIQTKHHCMWVQTTPRRSA